MGVMTLGTIERINHTIMKKHRCKNCKYSFGLQGEYTIVAGKGKFCDEHCIKEFESKQKDSNTNK